MAKGSGAASRSTMGTGVVFGMTIFTAIGLFLIPVCYVFVQKFSDKKKKAEPELAPPRRTRRALRWLGNLEGGGDVTKSPSRGAMQLERVSPFFHPGGTGESVLG